MRPRRPIQPFLLSTDQYFLHHPLVHIHPVPHLSLHTFFYCFASASFVRGLMPDRVSPVSITPHLLPAATQPQLHPISPSRAGKHKTLRSDCIFFPNLAMPPAKPRAAPRGARWSVGHPGRRPRALLRQELNQSRLNIFPNCSIGAPMNGFKGLLATLLRQQQLYWSCPLGDPTQSGGWRADGHKSILVDGFRFAQLDQWLLPGTLFCLKWETG